MKFKYIDIKHKKTSVFLFTIAWITLISLLILFGSPKSYYNELYMLNNHGILKNIDYAQQLNYIGYITIFIFVLIGGRLWKKDHTVGNIELFEDGIKDININKLYKLEFMTNINVSMNPIVNKNKFKRKFNEGGANNWIEFHYGDKKKKYHILLESEAQESVFLNSINLWKIERESFAIEKATKNIFDWFETIQGMK